MKLDKNTKGLVKAGDILKFSENAKYLVLNVIESEAWNKKTICYTLQNTKTKQVIYSQPSSECYGAELVRQ